MMRPQPHPPMLLAESLSAEFESASASEDRFYELLVHDDAELDAHILDASHNTTPQLLVFALLGALLYGFAVGLVAQLSVLPVALGAWLGPLPLVTIPISISLAFMVALLVCLPSFYFYTQLSGLDAPMVLVVDQALRAQARTSVLLLGALPVYLAVALAAVVGLIDGGAGLIRFGLLLPYLVGLAGLRSLYLSFGRLSEVLPVSHKRRRRFLPRMVAAWGLVYATVAPVALYRIVEALGAIF